MIAKFLYFNEFITWKISASEAGKVNSFSLLTDKGFKIPPDNGLAFLAAAQKVLQPTDMTLKIELPE
ncbi:hypothetical protein [Streptococcus cristatus]|uniref:hypothetical protein n=1 Tax=Streptococcus cristatus TaxID=45634 RepID=UPI00065FBA49|nr:hypothetical protein [Streptococcus cristatus]